MEPDSGTDLSSDRFDQQTSAVPASIDSQPAAEILPPSGQQAAPETGWPIFDLQLIGKMPFYILSRRYGELWELDDHESEELAKAWKPVLDKYLPLENTMWGTAALITLAIVGPRAMQTDWNKPIKKPKPNSIPPANTKTAPAGESNVTLEKENQEKQPEWDVMQPE